MSRKQQTKDLRGGQPNPGMRVTQMGINMTWIWRERERDHDACMTISLLHKRMFI